MRKTLYTINGEGKLETFTVLNEHYKYEGTTIEAYQLRDQTGRRIIVSKDLYKESELEAWKEYAEDIYNKTGTILKEIERLTKELHDLQNENSRVSNIIGNIKYNNK